MELNGIKINNVADNGMTIMQFECSRLVRDVSLSSSTAVTFPVAKF